VYSLLRKKISKEQKQGKNLDKKRKEKNSKREEKR
jgi:hypothetical protein